MMHKLNRVSRDHFTDTQTAGNQVNLMTSLQPPTDTLSKLSAHDIDQYFNPMPAQNLVSNHRAMTSQDSEINELFDDLFPEPYS